MLASLVELVQLNALYRLSLRAKASMLSTQILASIVELAQELAL